MDMKRIFDFTVAAIGLVFILPVMLVTALLVKRKMGMPVIFKQKRPGRDGKPFVLYKFRTMTNQKNDSGELLVDSERLTNTGVWLRQFSLDELPQLINVMKGDLSIVGPRPLLMQYLPLYNDRQRKRHSVKPGITGWAQVNGRNAISWEEKFEMDVWYTENRSFMLDMKIIYMTIRKVSSREGISQEGEATAGAFTGTEKKAS